MTSKDKTGDQLVASIRKSKTGPVAPRAKARGTTRKVTPRRTATIRETWPKASETPADSYSYGRRVWPD